MTIIQSLEREMQQIHEEEQDGIMQIGEHWKIESSPQKIDSKKKY